MVDCHREELEVERTGIELMLAVVIPGLSLKRGPRRYELRSRRSRNEMQLRYSSRLQNQ